jgi:Ca-activated chloride channel family protein
MWRGPTALARLATAVCATLVVAGLIIVPPPPGCIRLTVAASNEKSALLALIAKDYERRLPSVDGRCIEVQVARKPSGEAEEALARGWDERSDGPLPVIWSPAAKTWVALLERHRSIAGLPPIAPPSNPVIVRSPLVIAMLEPMARAMGWPTEDIGWSDVFDLARDPRGWGSLGHQEWGQFKLAKTSPAISTSGLHALIATYYAGKGTGVGVEIAPETIAFMRGVESSVVHYGDAVMTFLTDLLDCDNRREALKCVSAIAVEEKQVWDYNNGNPASDVTENVVRRVPFVPLVAIYPREGTLVADHPFVVLNATWVDDAERHAASNFLEYLQGSEAQRRFKQAALRGYDGDPGPEITAANRLDPTQPRRELSAPVPSVVSAIQASWKQIRKRARVLLVMDVAGSMGDVVGGTNRSKLDFAKEAAVAALEDFAGDDDVGLWSFSSASGAADQPYRELVPTGPVSQQKDQLRRAIAALQPEGARKALYTTVDAAVNAMRARFNSTRINAVVLLTDGANSDPANNDLNGLERSLRSQPDEAFVRVFTVGYGKQADLTALAAIALATRAGVYSSDDPRAIQKVLVAVISNF